MKAIRFLRIFLMFGGVTLPVWAGDLTFTAVNNNDGTLTISYSSFGDEPPVGIALKITDCNEVLPAVYNGDVFYDVIRTVDPNTSRITAFALLNTLGPDDPFPPLPVELATVNFGTATAGTMVVDTALGGIVNRSGAAVGNNLPLSFVVTNGLPLCWLCDGQDKGNANGDGEVNFIDLTILKSALFTCDGELGYNCCADFNRDGCINFQDLSILKENMFSMGYTACSAISCP